MIRLSRLSETIILRRIFLPTPSPHKLLFNSNSSTRDGTCACDYPHVMDQVASSHWERGANVLQIVEAMRMTRLLYKYGIIGQRWVAFVFFVHSGKLNSNVADMTLSRISWQNLRSRRKSSGSRHHKILQRCAPDVQGFMELADKEPTRLCEY